MRATHIAGSAADVQGVAGSLAMVVSAPLASAGGGDSAVPMTAVMLAGAVICVASLLFLSRSPGDRRAGCRGVHDG